MCFAAAAACFFVLLIVFLFLVRFGCWSVAGGFLLLAVFCWVVLSLVEFVAGCFLWLVGFVGYQFVLLVGWANALVGVCLGKALLGCLAVCLCGWWVG